MSESGGKRTEIGDLVWSKRLVEALQAFRAVDPSISANQILALLVIAREPGISQIALADPNHLDIESGSAARICDVLSERGNRGTPGKGLIEIGHAPNDYRSTAQFLTKKGRALLNAVRAIMSD